MATRPAWNSSGYDCTDSAGVLDSLCKTAFVRPAKTTRITVAVRRVSGLSVDELEAWALFDSTSGVVVSIPERTMTATTAKKTRKIGPITDAWRK